MGHCSLRFGIWVALFFFSSLAHAGWEPSECKKWAASSHQNDAPASCLKALDAVAAKHIRIDEKDWTKHSSHEQVVETYGGTTGERGTDDFSVDGEWLIRWESHGNKFHLTLYESVSNRSEELADWDGPGKSQKKFSSGGTFYLESETEGEWSIEVIELETGHSFDVDLRVYATIENSFDFPMEFDVDYDGHVQSLVLGVSEFQEIEHTVSLAGFSEEVSDAELLEEVDKPHIVAARSATPEAVAARKNKDKPESSPFTDEHHDAASDELRGFASESERDDREEEREQRSAASSIEMQRREKSNRTRTGLIAGGAITMVAGIVSGGALTTVGAIRRKDAQDELDAFNDSRPPGEPTVGDAQERGDLEGNVDRANRLVIGGAVLISAGVIVPTVLFILANRQKRKQKVSWSPLWGPKTAGLQLHWRF